MTADILHAEFLFFNSLFKKKDAVELEGKKPIRGQKRTQIQYIKMSHNRSTMAVKIREKK